MNFRADCCKQLSEEIIEISVVIPVYNVRPYLIACLDSVKEALHDINSEVICVDDGSDDGSADVLEQYVKDNPRFFAFHTDHIGASSARNLGISKAKGKFLAFVDSDDIVASTLYKDMLYLCKANNVNLCVCNVTRFEGDYKGVVSGQYQRVFDGNPKMITSIEDSMSFIYDGSPCNKLIKREFWDANGFSYPGIKHCQDMPVSLKLFCTADKFAVMHSFGYYWRITPGGASLSQQVQSTERLKNRIEVCKGLLLYIVENFGRDSSLAKNMINRFLCWEFDSTLWHFNKLSEDNRREFCSIISEFYKDVVTEKSLQDLPVFHRKRYEYIMNGETEELVRLMNHRRMGWRTAPIEERDREHYLKLPQDIYGQEYADASIELQDDIPVTRMSAFTQDGAKIRANVVVYQPRVNVSDANSQDIKAFLYNEHTGEKKYLPCVPLKVEPWTASYGEMICNDDYRVYHYNYDWAGITVTIDFEEVLSQDEASRIILDKEMGIKPRLMVYVEYKTPVLEGARPIRGFLPKAQKTIPSLDVVIEHEGQKYKYEFVQSIRDSLYIELNKL